MDFTKGLIASSAAILITQPLDTLKTQYQIGALKSTKALYKGTAGMLASYPVFWGVFFQMQQFAICDNSVVNTLVASSVASIVCNPLFVLKTRLQISADKTYVAETMAIWRNESWRGFFKGVRATLATNFKLPLQFAIYDYLSPATASDIAVASLISKLVANLTVYPLDVIRTIQRNSTCKTSIRDLFVTLYRSSGLYRGVLLYNVVSSTNFVILMLFKDFILPKIENR